MIRLSSDSICCRRTLAFSRVVMKARSLLMAQSGRTTYTEVVDTLGQPTSQTVNSDGIRSISYVYAQAQVRPATLIPFVGMFVGGADSRSNFVIMQFDGRGVLTDYSSSTSQFGTGTG